MAKVSGSSVVLYLTDDLYPAACARSITFDLSNDIIETSVKGSGNFRTYVQGAITWGGTIEGLTLLTDGTTSDITTATLYNWIISGFTVIAKWYEQDVNAQYYMIKQGEILLESVNETSSFDNMVTFSANFKGIGPITITTGNV